LKNFGKPGLEDGVVEWRNVLCPEKVEVRGRRNGNGNWRWRRKWFVTLRSRTSVIRDCS